MLMKISEYRQQFTEGSRPDRRTVIGWIENGHIYGERRGRDWYVDPERKVVVAANELVLKVLANQ